MANLLQVSRRETDAEKANTNFLEKRHPYAPVKLAHLVFVDRGRRDKQHSTEPEPGRHSGRHDGCLSTAHRQPGMHRASSPSFRRAIERNRLARALVECSGLGSRKGWRNRRDCGDLEPGQRSGLQGAGQIAGGEEWARHSSGQAHARGSPERRPTSPCGTRVLTGLPIFRRTCLCRDAQIQARQER